jgi:hypothetical protein
MLKNWLKNVKDLVKIKLPLIEVDENEITILGIFKIKRKKKIQK